MSRIVIDLEEIAPILVRELNMSDEDIANLRNHHDIPEGWSNQLLDILELECSIESKLILTITGDLL